MHILPLHNTGISDNCMSENANFEELDVFVEQMFTVCSLSLNRFFVYGDTLGLQWPVFNELVS